MMDQETGRSADLSRSHFVPVDMHILVYILSPRQTLDTRYIDKTSNPLLCLSFSFNWLGTKCPQADIEARAECGVVGQSRVEEVMGKEGVSSGRRVP